ncbi:MAG TPA: flagellar basal body P-ring protein FlgI [Tepidisphaeraceae bacterium]|jgi:hypothetical protein|nr:flagellar basal body P-ring protein FlgI [Tepidisphaeraceae bacterium]
MIRPRRLLRILAPVWLASVLCGCVTPPPKVEKSRYDEHPLRDVPGFMQGTLYQMADLQNDTPFLVSGWGLTVNLNATGGSTHISNNLKAFMTKQLEARGFGSKLNPSLEHITPGMVLDDKNTAVVAVVGEIPPGARKGQWFDVTVFGASDEVTSLARGRLYDTPLTIGGADPIHPDSPVNVFASASGPIFVNPALALRSGSADPAIKRGLQRGWVIGGGQVTSDRPLLLRLRTPENRLARTIEFRVNDYFHQDKVCTAFDMGFCQLWTPGQFSGDWEHFSKIVLHLYLQGGSEAFARAKARDLVAEARKPGAPLQDISYCLEGLGQYAMPEMSAVLADPSVPPEMRFAVARAAAYVGDPSGAAERTLFDFARDNDSNFQLAAVQVLGRVSRSLATNRLLRGLLDVDKTTVRVEAYQVLARNHDPSVETHVIGSNRDSTDEKFVLDFVHCKGAPLIYATRQGIPRIAIFGRVPELRLPLTFSAMDAHLMIASGSMGREVTIFYRDMLHRDPIQMTSPADLANVIARLAGQIDDGAGQLDFTYAEVLAILQGLSDERKLHVTSSTGQELAAALMIQQAPQSNDAIDRAPLLDRGRPQGDNAGPRLDSPPANPPAPGAQGRPQGPVGLAR